ncbi:MAG: hypothetical protein K2M77_07875 [Muribaculaceae bacterium]|nr:hypothetical protein [Muribaculaceae bacterium]
MFRKETICVLPYTDGKTKRKIKFKTFKRKVLVPLEQQPYIFYVTIEKRIQGEKDCDKYVEETVSVDVPYTWNPSYILSSSNKYYNTKPAFAPCFTYRTMNFEPISVMDIDACDFHNSSCLRELRVSGDYQYELMDDEDNEIESVSSDFFNTYIDFNIDVPDLDKLEMSVYFALLLCTFKDNIVNSNAYKAALNLLVGNNVLFDGPLDVEEATNCLRVAKQHFKVVPTVLFNNVNTGLQLYINTVASTLRSIESQCSDF